jgi:hypothetical protein
MEEIINSANLNTQWVHTVPDGFISSAEIYFRKHSSNVLPAAPSNEMNVLARSLHPYFNKHHFVNPLCEMSQDLLD